jgi:F-type H+-transporting ATPase subunit b
MDPNVIIAALPEIFTQLVGFGIVYLVLRKYAFGAVFQVIDERQKTITSSIEKAELKRLEMESLKNEYEERLQDVEQEVHSKIQLAVAEGQRIADEIVKKAHHDAAARLEHAKFEIQRETDNARALVRQEVVELSTLMASKLIEKNLSNEENEKYVLDLLSHTGELV